MPQDIKIALTRFLIEEAVLKRIKVHYYHIVVPEGGQTIHAILLELKNKALEYRLKQCGTQKIRLDDIEDYPQENGHTLWRLKFSKFRDDNWPGVSGTNQVAKDLELEDDEVLSEETLAIFSTISDRLVVQYNHFGVRASKIREYLNLSIENPILKIGLMPVLTNEALEKYKKKKIVTALDASLEGVNEADVAILNGSGIETALKKSVDAKVTSFRFTFSVDARVKKNKIDRGWVEQLVELIKNRAGDSDCLSVTAKENEEDAVEVMDLLESRKVTSFNAENIDRTVGRRYDSNQLYALLDQAMKEWEKAEIK